MIAEEAVALKDLIGQISFEEWETSQYREGRKGKSVRQAVLKKVWIWKKGTAEVEETQLLMSRKLDETQVKDSLCHEPEKELSVETALHRQMQRYWIERAFQEIKEQIGLAQYQVRGWQA